MCGLALILYLLSEVFRSIMMKKLVTLFFCAALLFSCKTRNAGNTDPSGNTDSGKPKDANAAVYDKVKFYENTLLPVQFDQVKMSGKLNVETGAGIPELNSTIYIEKDQKIWMNFAALFVNVARGMATPEGIKARNIGDRTYIESDYKYLNRMLNVNFIDYKTLEKLLMGRTFVKISDSQFKLTQNAQGFRMESVQNQKIETENGLREYKIALAYAPNYDLTRVQLVDVNSKDALEVTYSNWEAFSSYRLPKNVKIIIKGSKSGEILLENTKFDDSRAETPYSVPSSYKKVEIQ